MIDFGIHRGAFERSKPDRHTAQCIDPLGDGVDRKLDQPRQVAHDGVYRTTDGIHWAIALRRREASLARRIPKPDRGARRAVRAAPDLQQDQLEQLCRPTQLPSDDRVQIPIVYVLLSIGDFFESREHPPRLGLAERVAEVAKAEADCVPARVLAEYEAVTVHANSFRDHDLVGQPVLDDAVLVDACLVSERVRADDGLVRRHA